ncbi:MAG: hypothetical protein KBT27_03435 [Prevotellaceae bacterium]|nr:hypothetical protein [Candidatus Faecinaster equi]
MKIKSYSELITFPTFEERYRYLKLNGNVCEETFGYDRYLNQVLYHSPEWKRFRREIILRDNGCDLAIPDHRIVSRVYIHHLNPITLKDIEMRNPMALDPENAICVSFDTHQAIHYGDESLLNLDVKERHPNDTCPWR